jgi:U6 snRNA-associated Sm-like protein LSm7
MSKKENILELNKYIDKQVTVKFTGGREVIGTLKGFDTLVNLVLDECQELLRDPEDPSKITSETRYLGLVVCRGSALMLIHPTDGTEPIDNPFTQQEN